MKPPPMTADSKKIVATGYDRIAEAYLNWTSGSPVRRHWINVILSLLPPNARILDLGCGAGLPVALHLADAGHGVVGVDGSERQVALARDNVPGATFMAADMTRVEFEAASFDAVVAFYSITHVPRTEHLVLLKRIRRWLKPGGFFAGSLGHGDCPGWSGEWLGAPMFFSHFDAATNHALVEEAGLRIETAEVMGEEEHGTTVHFLWVIARNA